MLVGVQSGREGDSTAIIVLTSKLFSVLSLRSGRRDEIAEMLSLSQQKSQIGTLGSVSRPRAEIAGDQMSMSRGGTCQEGQPLGGRTNIPSGIRAVNGRCCTGTCHVKMPRECTVLPTWHRPVK